MVLRILQLNLLIKPFRGFDTQLCAYFKAFRVISNVYYVQLFHQIDFNTNLCSYICTYDIADGHDRNEGTLQLYQQIGLIKRNSSGYSTGFTLVSRQKEENLF